MGTRRKKVAGSAEEEEEEEEERDSEDTENSENENENEGPKRARKNGGEDFSRYEQIRDQRIKENKERMQKLGLFDLSIKLKPQNNTPNAQDKKKKKTLPPNRSPQRRSSRIMTLAPVNYHDTRSKEKQESNSLKKEVEICIPEGSNPEVFTEEQDKLLGDSQTIWEFKVDGCDIDGNRMYDPIKGETRHQQQQSLFPLGEVGYMDQTTPLYSIVNQVLRERYAINAGRKLFVSIPIAANANYHKGSFVKIATRYGENLIEVNQNSKWTCPACRGICNYSHCRKEKGWMPTGNIYMKVSKLGFKSMAHYLIQTCCTEISLEGSGAEDSVAVEKSETSADTKLKRPIRTKRALRS